MELCSKEDVALACLYDKVEVLFQILVLVVLLPIYCVPVILHLYQYNHIRKQPLIFLLGLDQLLGTVDRLDDMTFNVCAVIVNLLVGFGE